MNVLNGQTLATQRFTGTQAALRNAAHRVSDAIYEKILGVRGAFATRIAYVSVDGAPPTQRYQLLVADADGENPRMVLESALAASCRRPGRRTGSGSRMCRSRAAAPRCSCSACARASGARCRRAPASTARPRSRRTARKLALTLGGSGGNPDIYVLDLAVAGPDRVSRTIRPSTPRRCGRRTAQSLYFTSDRAGGPQIYRIGVRAGRPAEAHHLHRQLQRPAARLARMARSSRW